jgi:hypothetical protein
VQIVIDQADPDWNQLAARYERNRWEVAKREVRQLDASRSEMQAVEMDLRKPTGEHALLIVGQLDDKGRPIAAPTDDWKSFVTKLNSRLAKLPLLAHLVRPDASDMSAPACQVQLFARATTEFLSGEREQFRSVYRQVLSELRSCWETNEKSGGDHGGRGGPTEG